VIRLVVRDGPGAVALNYMWLPTWMGMNRALLGELSAELGPMLQGKALTDDVLDQAHAELVRVLERRYSSIVGLGDFLDGTKSLELR
jgi:hypothetical protein